MPSRTEVTYKDFEDKKENPRIGLFRSGDFFVRDLEITMIRPALVNERNSWDGRGPRPLKTKIHEEEKMKHGRVLIVSESQDRRNFLEYYVKENGFFSIWYPNVFASAKAIRNDPFELIIIDLSIPLEPKLALAKHAYINKPDVKMITIEKLEYLEKSLFLSEFPKIQSIPSIDVFPQKVKEYII